MSGVFNPTLLILLNTNDDVTLHVSKIFRGVHACSDLILYLNHLLERVHVLLHAVMRAQVGDEITGVHAVQAVEERVDAGVQVDQEHL